jgi:hypothetical protein
VQDYVIVIRGIMMMAYIIKIVRNVIIDAKIALLLHFVLHVQDRIETISVEENVSVTRAISIII